MLHSKLEQDVIALCRGRTPGMFVKKCRKGGRWWGVTCGLESYEAAVDLTKPAIIADIQAHISENSFQYS